MPKTYDDLDETGRTDFVSKWMTRISYALEREKTFREKGQHVVDIYEGKKPDETPFAIIYSNTEVLQPALYNARPIPIVKRRFPDADPVGKAAAEVGTRSLKFLIDTDSKDYDNFDELVQAANLDALLTNRGVTRFKYVAHSSAAYFECVYGEAVRWDKFFHGYARTWKKVPWIGFEWDMTKEEVLKNFPNISPMEWSGQGISAADDTDNKAESRNELKGVTLYKVYEIWDKSSGKVYFFSGVSRKNALRVIDDPLNLSGFFPVPRPLNFMKKVTTLVPTPLYEQYRSQAAELNNLTIRLKDIIKAIRYRGFFNGAIEDIEKALKAEDNEFIPVMNLQAMPEGAHGMDDLIWTAPIDKLVQTAQSLYQQRESCKSVIYEITGISDILRGASVASETATAQNIKNQWGTLRLKKMQKEVQRYCREALSIMLEIAAQKFEPQTLQQMTGLPFLFERQKQQINMQIQAAKQRADAIAQLTQQQPQPPQIPPELQQALQLPSWDQIIELLHNDVARAYKTDIETNSTIDAEASQDKQDISDLMNALSQLFNSIAPLVEQGAMPFGVAKEMLLVIARRYNFGSNLEALFDQMQDPQQSKGPDPQQAADAASAQAQAEQTKLDAAAHAQETQQKMALSKQEFDQKMKLMAAQAEVTQQELEIKKQELVIQRAALAMKQTLLAAQHEQKMERARKGAENADV